MTDSEWLKKVWGETRELISTDFYAKYELKLKVGGYCSLHYHMHRANRFWVTTGRVEVVEWYGPKVVKHLLGPDNKLDVPSLVPHVFIVHATGEMIEEYYADRGSRVRRDDIVRLTEGGMLEESNISKALETIRTKFDENR